jgi:hypothetical protein
MQTDQALRAGAECPQRDARGVGRQQGVGLHARDQLIEQCLFGGQVLDDGLQHQVGACDAVATHIRNQPVEGVADQPGILELARKERRRALHGARQVLRTAVLQGHGQAPSDGPGGDVSAHDAGADHMLMTGVEIGLIRHRAQLLPHQEEAHQMLSGAGGQQAGDGACLVAVECGGIAAMVLPMRNQGPGDGAPQGRQDPIMQHDQESDRDQGHDDGQAEEAGGELKAEAGEALSESHCRGGLNPNPRPARYAMFLDGIGPGRLDDPWSRRGSEHKKIHF